VGIIIESPLPPLGSTGDSMSSSFMGSVSSSHTLRDANHMADGLAKRSVSSRNYEFAILLRKILI